MIGYFIQDQESPFYQTPIFQHIIQVVQAHDQGQMKLKEKQTKNGLRLLLTVEKIPTVATALSHLPRAASERIKRIFDMANLIIVSRPRQWKLNQSEPRHELYSVYAISDFPHASDAFVFVGPQRPKDPAKGRTTWFLLQQLRAH